MTEVDINSHHYEKKGFESINLSQNQPVHGGGLAAAWKFKSSEISKLCENQSVVFRRYKSFLLHWPSCRDINTPLNMRNND